MPVGNAAYVEQFVRRAAQGDKREDEGSISSAQDHVGSLRVLGVNSQERLLLLRHCVAVKLSHLARFASAELFEQVTQNLQDDIEQEIRGLAQASRAEFSCEAMRLARMPLSMGGLGVMRMTRDAAAAAAMSSAASALARFSKSLTKKRKDLTWVTSLLQDTLAAPGGGGSESEPEDEADEEQEDEAKRKTAAARARRSRASPQRRSWPRARRGPKRERKRPKTTWRRWSRRTRRWRAPARQSTARCSKGGRWQPAD